MIDISRRSLVRAGAWAVPTVIVAAAAPSAAASPAPARPPRLELYYSHTTNRVVYGDFYLSVMVMDPNPVFTVWRESFNNRTDPQGTWNDDGVPQAARLNWQTMAFPQTSSDLGKWRVRLDYQGTSYYSNEMRIAG